MRIIAAAVLAALPLAAAAQPGANAAAGERGYHERLYARYCDKLREGPDAYAQFVHRQRAVHGFTYEDFARREPGAPVRHECQVANERLAQAKPQANPR
jgi:hypothetical protein